MAKWQTTDFNNYNKKNEERKETRKEILKLAKIACEKLGGLAEIGDGFYIFNSKEYKVVKIGDSDD